MAIRYNLYGILEDDKDVKIYDSTTVNWNDFKWSNGYDVHYITKSECLKPYLISHKYYGNVEYEDIILLLNNIIEIEKIPVGSEIRVPKIEDIKSFLLENRIS